MSARGRLGNGLNGAWMNAAKPPWPPWLDPAIIAILAIALRCVGLGQRGLWYDELLSANFTSHGPWSTLLTVLRFDVHPPLYYEQLSLWSSLGRADPWLMANSILWSAAAAVILAIGGSRLHGRATGLWAGVLLAISPAALAYGDQVRMYPMIMAIIVAVWFAQALWLERPRFLLGLLLALLEATLVYSHTVGVIMLSGCVVMGAAAVLTGGSARRLWIWVALQGGVGLCAIPVLIVDVSRNVGHIPPLSWLDVASTWSLLTTGACVARDYAQSCGLGLSVPILLASIAILALLAAVAAFVPVLRLEVAALIALPLALVAIASLTIKPIWLDRVFVGTIPFFALALARLAADPTIRVVGPLRSGSVGVARLAAPALVGLLWLWLGVVEQSRRLKSDGYTAAAAYLTQATRPGDEVEMADKVEFWAFMWRFAGADWGDPLHTYVASPSWARLTAKAPALIRARLVPDRLRIPVRGVEAVLLDPDRPLSDVSGDVFTVGLSEEVFSPHGRSMVESRVFPPLVVQRWRPTAR
jgi:hypothetical protein